MAESAIASIVLPVLFEKLASGMLQHLGKMLGVTRELEKLQSTLTTIKSVLRDAEEKEVKDEPLRDWLAKLKNATYDADDVLDEIHYELMWRSADIHHGIKNKVNDFFSSHNPLFFRRRMARKVKDIVNKLDEIAAERSKFHLRSDGAVEESRFPFRETYSYVKESEVVGRREDKRKIVDMLISNASSSSGANVAPRVLPIVGMGGLGKTTLAQMVYNDEEMTAYFELRMWVCVSEDFSIRRLVKEIILSGGGSGTYIDDMSMDQLQQKLKETLSLKRYLLVLDDIWNEDPQKWRGLGVLLTFGGEGSVILVTTRSEKVATVVGTLDPFPLAHLSEDGCWELFEQRAFPGSTGMRPELVEIGKKIAKRCKGLPLAANVIGSMMHLMTEEREWLDVLESEVWDMQDGKDGILSVLKLSYQQLPSHLKQCFAFCAIFPKDHEIKKEQLIQLWMANGFIPAQGRLQLEEKGEYIFKELASRSFFQDVKVAIDYGRTITMCKMHDLIHDLAQSIMSNDCVILNDEQLKRTSDDAAIRHLEIVDNTNSSTLNASTYNSRKTLRTLMAPQFCKQVPYSIWPNLRSLRVLDLQRSRISDVPISVNNLKHLRYLDLSYTSIETLPEAISQLFYLQTLKIERCGELRKLPKGMRNMCNLRHVYNRGCDRLDSMPRGLDKLSHLQTLTMFVASKKVGSGCIAELEDLNLGGVLHLRKLENVMSRTDAAKARLGSKKKIDSLVLEWGFSREEDSKEITKAKEILEALRPHEEIQNLRIDGYRGQQCPSWLVRCRLLKKLEIYKSLLSDIPALASLTELTVENCPLLCPATRGFFRNMTCLEELRINRSDKLVLLLESEDDGDDEWSSPLQVLTITNNDARMFSSESCLGTWKNLNSLERLDFISCSELVSFPDDLLPALRSLRKLSIISCEKFTGGEGGLRLQRLTSLEDLIIDNCPALHSVNLEGLHRLRDLSISHCSKLKGLQGLTALPSLRTLRIWDCESFTGGEGGLKLQHLTSLESLQIINCSALHSVNLEGSHRLRDLYISHCSELNGLQGLTALPSLRTLRIWDCESFTGGEGGLMLQHLTSLESLQIVNCSALHSVNLEGSHRLRDLYISHCSELNGLQGLTALPSLRTLRIWDCESFTGGEGGLKLQYLTSLESLQILNCSALHGVNLEGSHRLRDLDIGQCSKLNGLQGLTSLRTLKLTDLATETTLPDWLPTLTGLNSLEIKRCPALTALPDGMEGLTLLNRLEIDNCPLLAGLPVGLQQRLPHLQTLIIIGCPLLEGGDYWHLISSIPGVFH